MAKRRTYKRDKIGRFAGGGSSGATGEKNKTPSLRSRLARAQRSRLANRNHNDRLGLSGASVKKQTRVKKRIAKRNTKIAASRSRHRR